MMRHKEVTALFGMAALLLALTACDPAGGGSASPPATAPATASPSSTPSETPSPSPVAHPAAVIVDGDSVSVIASEGGVMIDIPFTTDPSTAVSQLNSTIGYTGALSIMPSSGCYHERQASTWSGLSFIWGPDWARAPGAAFMASVTGPDVGGGLKVTIPSGHWVGNPGPAVLAANASAPNVDYGAWVNLRYHVISGTETGNPDNYYGANAVIQGGVLTSFASPIYFNYDC
ncbi:MAG TPA: hypothetical protein PJ998_01975 [Terrimesophilobacter sp.]|nr:hypothetical protein [Terrimesophilobacter sp.]